jgi:hypothetical protein
MIATKDSLYRNKLLYCLCQPKDAGPIIAAPSGRSAQNPDATRKWRRKTLIVFDSDSEMTASAFGDFRQALRRPCPQARFRSGFVVGFRAGFAAFGEASALEPPLAFTSAA